MICACQLNRRALLTGALATGLAAAAPAPHRIDIHHHIAPPTWLKAFQAWQPGPSPMARWSIQASLDDMDAAGVAKAVVSITAPGTFRETGIAAGRQMARECNDYARQLCDDHPTRFAFFTALPAPDIDGCLAEIAHALDQQGAQGVGLLTSYGDKWLGDPIFFPMLEELNRRKAVVYTHPAYADCCRNLQPNVSSIVVEFGADTSRAMASIIFSGAAARFPDIRWIFSHAGGATPFLVERFTQQAMTPAAAALYPNGLAPVLARFFYDTAQSSNRTAMGALKTIAPTTQILFGTDYPFRTSRDHVDGLRQSRTFTAAELRAIERTNALRLLPRLGPK
jgi:predicted TIM-barrel fold metal-dependent hydrolase